jgi:hypothetical protein
MEMEQIVFHRRAVTMVRWSVDQCRYRRFWSTAKDGMINKWYIIINGLGYLFSCIIIKIQMICFQLLTEPWKLPLEIFQIKVNENILLRVINGGVAQQLMLAIEDHELTIVATDGSPIKPIVVCC